MAIIFWYVRDFFKFIGIIISSVFSIFLSLINILVASAKFLYDVIAVLPTSLTIFFTVIVVICLLYKILGREGGSE